MENLEKILIPHLVSALKLTFVYGFALLGPGLFLAFANNLVSGIVKKGAFGLLGRKLYLALFGWLGTAIHEAGHAIMCLIFAHRITEMKLFSPDPQSGTLGYVSHSYNRKNPYQQLGNFFIALGPILLGAAVIYTAAYFLLGPRIFSPVESIGVSAGNFGSLAAFGQFATEVITCAGNLLADIFTQKNAMRWQFYVFLYVLFCVGSSMELSKADIVGGAPGFFFLIILLFAGSLTAHFFGGLPDSWIRAITGQYSLFYTVMFFTLIANTVLAVFFSVLRLLRA